MLLALLQLHVANSDNLAHEADAGPDEVCAAEVLWGREHRKRKSRCTLSPPISFY